MNREHVELVELSVAFFPEPCESAAAGEKTGGCADKDRTGTEKASEDKAHNDEAGKDKSADHGAAERNPGRGEGRPVVRAGRYDPVDDQPIGWLDIE